MKLLLSLSALLFLLFFQPVLAEDASTSFVELTDAPTITVDWSKGSTQAVTLHGNRILSFENGQKGRKYLLILQQDSKGSRTVTWPERVQWPGYQLHPPPPTLTTTADKKDFIGFFYDGENYDAVSLSQSF